MPFIPTATTDYIVTGIGANGCENYSTITVELYNLPELVETVINENYGNDGSISLDVILGSGSQPFLFDWDIDGLGDNDDEQNLTD